MGVKNPNNKDDDDDEDGKMVGTVFNRKNNKQEDEKSKFQAFSGKGVSFASEPAGAD